MASKTQPFFRWLVIAALAFALLGTVLGVVLQAVRVERYNSANLLPYLVDTITLPKYVLAIDVGLALWFFLRNRRTTAYWLFLASIALLFLTALFNLGKWYPEANYVSQLEFTLLSWAQLSGYVMLVLLGPIGIFGLMNQRAASSGSSKPFGG